MKKLLFFLLISVSALSQENFEENCIYIFTRSTTSKKGFIAEDFNIRDSLSTHVGIGFFKKENFVVYNVDNVKKSKYKSSLIREDYPSFVNLNDIHYSSIWKYQVDTSKMNQLFDVLKSFESKNISFDKEFKLDNSSTNLYCSEFVFIVLEKLALTKSFSPIKKNLSGFYKNILKQSSLEYIPVDFFLELNYFELVKEKFYNL